MKKIKFICSLYKERDWLETMAAEGWLLEDITLGIIYSFKKIQPAQKVYEIERFGVSDQPNKQELTAKRTALDIAAQVGWEVVAHDEEMNYYFVKDKAGDETDEFFDDQEMRMERAEKFRRRFGVEQPVMLLNMLLCVTILFIPVFLLGASSLIFLYIACSIMILLCSVWLIRWSQKTYYELSLTRKQWEEQKKYGQKKRFTRVDQMTSWLKEQEAKGLVLSGFEDGKYLFTKGTEKYDYFADTRHALSKRLKTQGTRYTKDQKDWNEQSTKWYEMSVEQAEKAELELVCAVEKGTLLYRRPHSDKPAPFDTQRESMGAAIGLKQAGMCMVVLLIALAAGFCSGYFAAELFK